MFSLSSVLIFAFLGCSEDGELAVPGDSGVVEGGVGFVLRIDLGDLMLREERAVLLLEPA